MNKSKSDAFLFFTNNYPPAIALVFTYLYHWGTIAWAGHAAGDWFFKSIRDLAKELNVSKQSVERAYKIIQNGECHFFESKVEKKKNYKITYLKVSKEANVLLKNHCHDSQDSEKPTVMIVRTVPSLSSGQYRHDSQDGINIITHNKNSMSIRDAREDHKPNDQQKVEVTKRQTDDSLKMVEIWNALIRPSKPETMTTRREQQCFEVLRDHFNNDLDNWRQHCIRISQSSWLTGDDFTLYLSWALKPEHIEKIQNGGYDDNAHKLKKKALAESSKQLPTLPLDEALSDCKSEVDRKVKEVLFHKMDPNAYASWIGGTGKNAVIFEVKNGYICVSSCNKFFEDTIKTKFWGQVEQAYAAVYNSLSDCKTSLIDHREGVDVDLLIYSNKPLTSTGDVLWAK